MEYGPGTKLTLRHPNCHVPHAPVVPDLAQTVMLGSDHSENLMNVFVGAKNDNFSPKFLYNFRIFEFDFYCEKFLWCVTL